MKTTWDELMRYAPEKEYPLPALERGEQERILNKTMKKLEKTKKRPARPVRTALLAAAIAALGIDVTVVNKLGDDDSELRLLAENKLGLIVYTGASSRSAYDDYITLHRQALLSSVACVTSLDTANALADIAASRYSLFNTELIDINDLRAERQKIRVLQRQQVICPRTPLVGREAGFVKGKRRFKQRVGSADAFKVHI